RERREEEERGERGEHGAMIRSERGGGKLGRTPRAAMRSAASAQGRDRYVRRVEDGVRAEIVLIVGPLRLSCRSTVSSSPSSPSPPPAQAGRSRPTSPLMNGRVRRGRSTPTASST